MSSPPPTADTREAPLDPEQPRQHRHPQQPQQQQHPQQQQQQRDQHQHGVRGPRRDLRLDTQLDGQMQMPPPPSPSRVQPDTHSFISSSATPRGGGRGGGSGSDGRAAAAAAGNESSGGSGTGSSVGGRGTIGAAAHAGSTGASLSATTSPALAGQRAGDVVWQQQPYPQPYQQTYSHAHAPYAHSVPGGSPVLGPYAYSYPSPQALSTSSHSTNNVPQSVSYSALGGGAGTGAGVAHALPYSSRMSISQTDDGSVSMHTGSIGRPQHRIYQILPQYYQHSQHSQQHYQPVPQQPQQQMHYQTLPLQMHDATSQLSLRDSQSARLSYPQHPAGSQQGMYQSPVAAASAYDTQGQSYSQQRYAGSEPSFAPVPLGQSASYAPQSSVDPHGEPHLSNETVFTQDPLQQYNYPPAQQFEPRRMGATLFRYKTVMTIPLTPSGNFVVEVPVPEKVFHAGKYRGREFSHLRYTAVVGDPDEFYERGYYLRQGEENRTTELFIVVTMYNEDEAMFLKTWKSLRRNIDYLCKKTGSPVWGPDGWKKIVVCLVSDGRSKIHQKTLATLGVLGVYQEGLIKTSINDQDVSAHVFEYTTSVYFNSQISVRKEDTTHFPVQVLFCLKERNAKKINSHRWFFNAFGRILNPNVCVLIDVGTKPTERSLYYLWKEFDHNHNVAGACGEIYAEQGRCSAKLFNPLVAAQNFEYKMSNILDKPFESVFGFISVLPGAFSAYRYRALQHRGDGTGPLEKYFMGEKMHGGPNLTMANMYLAEDRILCFELVTKRDEAWVLRYVKRAKAETDVPDSVPEYISQRRRWLNGSFFAGLHAIIHFYQIFRSGHTFWRKMALLFLTLYNVVNLLFNWFAVANFFLAFYFLSIRIVQQRITDPFFGFGGGMFITLRELYLFALIMIFIASLGNRPQGSKHLYVFCFLLFALIMATLLYMSGFTINMAIKRAITPMGQNSDGTPLSSALGFTRLLAEPAFRDLVLSMTSTYGVYLFASVMHGDPWHMLTSFVQYLLMLPSFVNILMVYAFCNLHDVSWGTKGDNKPVEPPAAVHAQQTESGQVVTVDLPVNQKDIDANYNYFVNALQPSPGEDAAARRDRRSRNAMQQEDYFKAFRTRVVLFWLLSNVTLLVVFTSTEILAPIGINPTDPNAFNPFLTFVLWSTAGLAIVRFIGSSAYICLQNRK